MANKTFNTRVISKHDTETNWNKATNFVPLAGEIIIYDQDTNNPQRIKIGDGTTTVINLPFVVNTAGEDLGLVKTGGDVTITNGTITVNDDSHNHLISNVDGLQTALDAKANNHSHPYASNIHPSAKASSTELGHVTIGDNISVSNGKISVPAAGSSLGLVKSGGDVTISGGTITIKDDSHNHTIANIDGLQTALDGKAVSGHTHSIVTTSTNGFMSSSDKSKLDEIESGANKTIVDSILKTDSENPVQNKVISETISNINTSITNINTALSKKANLSHTHTISSIDGLQNALDGKASTHTHPYAPDTHPSDKASATALGHIKIGDNINIDEDGVISVSVDSALDADSINPVQNKIIKSALDGKANSSHTHTMTNITGLDAALSGKANSSHTHSIANITNLQSTLDSKAAVHSHPYASDTHNHDSQYAPLSHVNAIASDDTLGHVKIGSNINIDEDGIITVKDDGHAHIIANIDGLQAALNAKANNHSHPYLPDNTLYAGSSTQGGPATSAVQLTTTAVGSTNQPVYFSDGKPVTIGYTIKSSVPAGAKFTDTTYSVATTSADGLMSFDDKIKLDGIAAGANNYSLPVAGEELGGVKEGGDVSIDTSGNITVDKATALKSNAGATNQPIYFKDGKPTATSYALNATVPAGAKFTDTVYTHPVYTNKASGLYKITVNNLGHVSSTAAVEKADITALGIPELVDGKIPQSQLPSYVDDVVEFASRKDFPETGENGKIYVACDTNKTYRWSNTTYIEISASLALGETLSTAYRGDRGKIAYEHSQSAHAPSNAQKNSDITKAEIEAKLTGNISSHTHSYLSSNTKYAGSSSIGGSADSAVKLTAENIGSTTQPVYFLNGVPKATTYTLGASVPSNAEFTDTTYSVATSSKLGLIKAATSGDINVSADGIVTVKDDSHNHTIANIDDLQTTLNGKANSSHTHNYAGSSSAGGSANSAVKLTTARTINVSDGVVGTATSFNGTANISIPVTSVKEAYLSWGGKNFSGSYGPIDAAMIPNLSANRFAYAKAEGITIEYTQDGSTWTDYGASNAQKLQLTTTGASLTVGKPSSTTQPTSNFKLRITFTTSTARIYSVLNKFAIYCSTNYSNDCTCKIQTATHAAPTTFVDKTDKIPIFGWSGWNIINTSPFTTYSNSGSQYEKVRFLFEIGGHTASKPGTGLQIQKIFAYGGVGWTTPSNLAQYGTIYSADYNQNTTFPANVTASNFVKSGSSNSYILLGGGGTKPISDFATSGHTHSHTHTFKPVGSITSTFTGTAATLSKSYTPAGTISQVVTNVTSGSTTVNSVTGVGSLPSLTHSYDSTNRKLTLSFSAGSLPTYSGKSVLNSISPTKAAPTFTGTAATISMSYTPAGTVSSTFEGTQGTTSQGS